MSNSTAVLSALTAVALSCGVTAASASADTAVAPARVAVEAPPVDMVQAMAHLEELAKITMDNGAQRSTGSTAFVKSMEWLEGILKGAGFTVTRQPCKGCTRQSDNLIAEFPTGDANAVHLFGAHLDSVAQGPGMNDNGAGTITLLQAALAHAKLKPNTRDRVRFAWWTDEENGFRGSASYVKSLSAADKKAIKGYYNIEMTGGRNGGNFISDARSSTAAAYTAYFKKIGKPLAEIRDVISRSDDASFSRAGIPASTLAGAGAGNKTQDHATKFGGQAGQPYDPCYHQTCDKLPEAINKTHFETLTSALIAASFEVGGTAATP